MGTLIKLAFAGSWHRETDIRLFGWGLCDSRDGIARLQDYDLIVGALSAYGWPDHVRFWNQVARKNSGPIYMSGGIARHEPRRVFLALPESRGYGTHSPD